MVFYGDMADLFMY